MTDDDDDDDEDDSIPRSNEFDNRDDDDEVEESQEDISVSELLDSIDVEAFIPVSFRTRPPTCRSE